MAKKQKSFLESYQSFKNQKNRGKPETVVKREEVSSLKYTSNPKNQDKVNQYNSARKEMGMQTDSNLTKKKYDSYFGNANTGDKGIYGRYQEYKSKQTTQNKPSSSKGGGFSFDKTVDKGLSKLSKTFSSLKSEASKLANKNDVTKGYVKGMKTTAKALTHLPGVQNKINEFKLGMKATDKEDQYVAAPTRSVLKDFTDKKKQTPKDVLDNIKKNVKGDIRTSGEEIAKNLGIKSKYGAKLTGFGIEALADPANLVGAGAYKSGAKAIKGLSKLGKVAKIAEEVAPTKELNGETTKLIKRINDKGKVTPSDAKKIIKTINDPKQIKALEEVPNPVAPNISKTEPTLQKVIEQLPKREQNLKNIKLPQGKIEVRPTVKKSLTDLMGLKKQIEQPNIPITPREIFEQKVQQSIPQTPVNAISTNAIQTSIEKARKTGDIKDVVNNTDSLIKDLEVNHVDDDELNLLKDEMNGLKINLQTFAATAEAKEELLKRIEKVNKQTETLLKSRQKKEMLKGMTIPEKKQYDINRHQADLNHLQNKLDDLNQLENSSVGHKLSPEVAELKSNLESRLARKQKMLSESQKPLTQSEEFRARADEVTKDLVVNSKDLKTFTYNRETPARIAEGVAGKEKGKQLYDEFFMPTQLAETERINFLNGINDKFKGLQKNFKISNKDDELVQMYGEGKISEVDLKSKTKNWENVIKATEEYRKFYDDVLTQINDALVRNGYDPIPKRKDYFPHYNSKNSLMKDLFGIDLKEDALPTDINGLTDQFRPGKQYVTFAGRRIGEKTNYGALEGLSQYIQGASNLIYHTDNIKRIRSLEDAVREANAGTGNLSNFSAYLRNYGDQLAGKKGRFDRAFEETMGRGVYNLTKTLTSNLGSAMVGGNLTSAISGLIPLSTAAATTSKTAMAKALKDTIASAVKNDGFTTPFMVRRMGADPLYMNKFQNVKDKAFWMMKQVDNFSTNVIVRGKYNELIKKGLSHEEAVKGADEYASKVMADRSKGQTPLLFNQRILSPITQFQLEVNNQLSHVFKDIPQFASMDAKSKAVKVAKITAAYTQLAIYGWLYNEATSRVTGRRTALDPIDYAKSFYEGNSLEGTKNIVGQIPGSSIVVEGRAPIDSALPDIPGIMQRAQQSDSSAWDVTKDIGKEVLKGSPYLLGVPGYGQFNKSYQGYKADKNEASLTDSGMLRYPIDVNPLKAAQLGAFGQYSTPEAKQYFDISRKPMGGKRAAAVMGAEDRQGEYLNQLVDRKQDSIDRAKGDKEKLEKFKKQLAKLKEAKDKHFDKK